MSKYSNLEISAIVNLREVGPRWKRNLKKANQVPEKAFQGRRPLSLA